MVGDLIFVKGHAWWDEAIEFFEGSVYSHVAGLVRGSTLVEAQGFRKVGFRPLDYYAGIYDVFTCDALTDEQRTLIRAYVANQIGDHYDYMLIAWEALRYVFHVALPYHEPYHSRICSTLWSDAYLSVGVDLCPGVKYPSPGDLATSQLLRRRSESG